MRKITSSINNCKPKLKNRLWTSMKYIGLVNDGWYWIFQFPHCSLFFKLCKFCEDLLKE